MKNQELAKVMESKAKVRFQDCDPYGHLYNARFLDYFMNAREDHLLTHYDLDIYDYAKHGLGWVVAQNQISYFDPANIMETVSITTKLIQYNQKSLTVESIMYNDDCSKIKSILWTKLIHFHIPSKQSHVHEDEMMELFEKVVVPIGDLSFDERKFELLKIAS